jgi:hypothetical protein
MENLTPQQQKKINKLSKIVENGELAILEYLLEIEEKLEETEETVKELIETYKPDFNSILEQVKGKDGKDGEKGDSADPEEVAKLLSGMPYFMERLKGEKGDSYSLTEKDKEDILKSIKVPTIEKVIEKIETIVEKPIITEIVKEKALKDTPDEIVSKLESIQEENRKLDKKAIKGLVNELNEIRERVQGTISGGRQLRMVTFSFNGDGMTSTFSLPQVPGAKGYAIWAYYQGQHLQIGEQIEIIGKTLSCKAWTPESDTVINGFLII